MLMTSTLEKARQAWFHYGQEQLPEGVIERNEYHQALVKLVGNAYRKVPCAKLITFADSTASFPLLPMTQRCIHRYMLTTIRLCLIWTLCVCCFPALEEVGNNAAGNMQPLPALTGWLQA